MSANFSFAGKNILITGGTRGIGLALVKRFHEEGAKVYTIGKNPERVAQLQRELAEVTAKVVDLEDWKATREVVASFGPMDYLINNAGIIKFVKFMDVDEDTLDNHFNVNVKAVLNVSQVVAKGMITRGTGGAIINFSSVAARQTIPNDSAYGLSKVAVEKLTKVMAVELGPHNIRVNAVAAGLVNVGMIDTLREMNADWCETFSTNYTENLVVRRLIEAKEIVDLMMFLLSPLSGMIVGESVLIDGGGGLCAS